MAVDGGGFPGTDLDPGERIVIPALEALGAKRLWLAVSTHPHPDHVIGLTSVVRMGRPELLWLPASFAGDGRYRPLLEAARGASEDRYWDLVHALRVAGHSA
jgi:competence protein ComEC